LNYSFAFYLIFSHTSCIIAPPPIPPEQIYVLGAEANPGGAWYQHPYRDGIRPTGACPPQPL